MKLAVTFPGIGYHNDRPLLYYGKKLVKELGYEVQEISYSGFPSGLKGNSEKMAEALAIGYGQARVQLDAMNLSGYEEVVFLSKSIGTAIAARYQREHGLLFRNVYMTPIAESFQYIQEGDGIVFHGTGDDWADSWVILSSCRKNKLPLYGYEGADHSLETGDVREDLEIVQDVMENLEDYLLENSGE